jgi:hypothetical protein
MTRKITVKEFIDQGNNDLGHRTYIEAHGKMCRVKYVKWPEMNPWVYCPEVDAGFGMSFCVAYNDTLHVEED